MKQEPVDYAINMHRLHIEWERQPKLYHEAADKLAAAENEVDRLKAKMELVEAQMFIQVKENPSRFGLKRASDKTAELAVLDTIEFQKAQGAYLAAKAEARTLNAEVRYLDQRKTAIEYLSRLRLQDYFADPRIGNEEREEGDARLRREVVAATRGR